MGHPEITVQIDLKPTVAESGGELLFLDDGHCRLILFQWEAFAALTKPALYPLDTHPVLATPMIIQQLIVIHTQTALAGKMPMESQAG